MCGPHCQHPFLAEPGVCVGGQPWGRDRDSWSVCGQAVLLWFRTSVLCETWGGQTDR